MVRQKSRWLLAKIEQEDAVKNLDHPKVEVDAGARISISDVACSRSQQPQPATIARSCVKIEKKNIYHALCATIRDAFGICGAGVADDIQGECSVRNSFNLRSRSALVA